MIEIKITKVHNHDFDDCLYFYKVGDIIKEIIYMGEGYFEVLHKGQVRSAGYRYNPDNRNKVDRSPYDSCNPIEGDIIQNKEKSVFTAKIRMNNGKQGWIKIIHDDFKNINNWDSIYSY